MKTSVLIIMFLTQYASASGFLASEITNQTEIELQQLNVPADLDGMRFLVGTTLCTLYLNNTSKMPFRLPTQRLLINGKIEFKNNRLQINFRHTQLNRLVCEGKNKKQPLRTDYIET